MPTSTQELQSFQKYAAARIQNGGAMLELDELLDEWKHQNPNPQQLQEDALAIKASLRDIERGKTGTPVDDVIADLQSHQLTRCGEMHMFFSQGFF